MARGKKIDDLLKPKRRAKDYAKIIEIFKLYGQDKYETMMKEIFFYHDFEFFNDILVYLDNTIKSESVKHFIFEDISNIYINNYEWLWQTITLKSRIRKWKEQHQQQRRQKARR